MHQTNSFWRSAQNYVHITCTGITIQNRLHTGQYFNVGQTEIGKQSADKKLCTIQTHNHRSKLETQAPDYHDTNVIPAFQCGNLRQYWNLVRRFCLLQKSYSALLSRESGQNTSTDILKTPVPSWALTVNVPLAVSRNSTSPFRVESIHATRIPQQYLCMRCNKL